MKKYLAVLLISFFVSLSISPADAKKKKPKHIPWKEPTNCASVIGIREKQGPNFASKFYFDLREAKRIERCLNKRKNKQEIYYIVKE